MMPALIAGTGLGILPEFILRDALADRRLKRLLEDWSLPSGSCSRDDMCADKWEHIYRVVLPEPGKVN
jgi:DNA-binding transcriptional LysR family regulator